MINGNGGHECNCTEQEHTDSGLTWTRIRETAKDTSLLISTKAARGIVAASKYILPHRFLLRDKNSQLLLYMYNKAQYIN